MPTQQHERTSETVIHTTLAALAPALARHLDYYRTQGIPVEEMEVVFAIAGKDRLKSWSLQWPEPSPQRTPPRHSAERDARYLQASVSRDRVWQES